MVQEMDFTNVRISDEDVLGWIRTLRDGGFSDDEIDWILGNLNKNYRLFKDPDFIEKELKKIGEKVFKRHGKFLTNTEKNYLRKVIKSRLED